MKHDLLQRLLFALQFAQAARHFAPTAPKYLLQNLLRRHDIFAPTTPKYLLHNLLRRHNIFAPTTPKYLLRRHECSDIDPPAPAISLMADSLSETSSDFSDEPQGEGPGETAVTQIHQDTNAAPATAAAAAEENKEMQQPQPPGLTATAGTMDPGILNLLNRLAETQTATTAAMATKNVRGSGGGVVAAVVAVGVPVGGCFGACC